MIASDTSATVARALETLYDSLGRQTHRASMHLAMQHLPRIEDRIVALFAAPG